MLAKLADHLEEHSVRARAGAEAERNMAFHLRRAFGDHRPDVWVFNDLRIEHEGEVAQMDHLVLHRFGFVIVESKSVGTSLEIKHDGQFIIQWRLGKKAIPSPVAQARSQAALLRRLLAAHTAALLDPMVFGVLQKRFAKCPMELRVAVSGAGIIKGDKHAREVRRAELITDEIEERLKDHKQGASYLRAALGLNNPRSDDGLYELKPSEIERIRDFLLAQHKPRTAGQPRPPQSQEQALRPTVASSTGPPAGPHSHPANTPLLAAQLCSSCKSSSVQVVSGKLGYYFKCQACDGNTSIDLKAGGLAQPGRVRQEGSAFHLMCRETGRERLLFVNSAAAR